MTNLFKTVHMYMYMYVCTCMYVFECVYIPLYIVHVHVHVCDNYKNYSYSTVYYIYYWKARDVHDLALWLYAYMTVAMYYTQPTSRYWNRYWLDIHVHVLYMYMENIHLWKSDWSLSLLPEPSSPFHGPRRPLCPFGVSVECGPTLRNC